MKLSWDQVFAWRMQRQMLDPPGSASVVEVVRGICGVQSQVASSAEMAVAVRQEHSGRGQIESALRDRSLVKTWAMRGTLHVLPPDVAGAYLALVAAARSWEKPSWQRAFGVGADEMAALAEVTAEALEGRVLSRNELVAEVVARTGAADLGEQLRSGWSAVLKPLAWQGILCQGPAQGNRVTFTRPDTWLPSWGGMPSAEEAAATAIPSYLGAHGPATIDTFDQWLTRGGSKRAALRSWFGGLGDLLATVEIEGEEAYAVAEHAEEIASTSPTDAVRLLPGFDQFLLGPGTADARLVLPGRRPQVSKSAGWISPVVVAGGRVSGVWKLEGDAVEISWFGEAGPPPVDALEAETKRFAAFYDSELRCSIENI